MPNRKAPGVVGLLPSGRWATSTANSAIAAAAARTALVLPASVALGRTRGATATAAAAAAAAPPPPPPPLAQRDVRRAAPGERRRRQWDETAVDAAEAAPAGLTPDLAAIANHLFEMQTGDARLAPLQRHVVALRSAKVAQVLCSADLE